MKQRPIKTQVKTGQSIKKNKKINRKMLINRNLIKTLSRIRIINKRLMKTKPRQRTSNKRNKLPYQERPIQTRVETGQRASRGTPLRELRGRGC